VVFAFRASESIEECERRRRLRSLNRNYYRADSTSQGALVRRACAWLLPWPFYSYPGALRGISQLLGGRVTVGTVSNWRCGGYVGTSALLALAEEIERRANSGLGIAAELRREAESRRPRLRGLQIRDPETGLPKYRSRVGAGSGLAGERPAERKL
jgi:hypothetical protein